MTPERKAEIDRQIDEIETSMRAHHNQRLIDDAIGLLQVLDRLGWKHQQVGQLPGLIGPALVELLDYLETHGWRRTR